MEAVEINAGINNRDKKHHNSYNFLSGSSDSSDSYGSFIRSMVRDRYIWNSGLILFLLTGGAGAAAISFIIEMLDMLEPLRPRIGEFVIDFLLNYAKKRHFTTNNQDGCLLNKEGRGAYYPLWSQWLFADRNGISFYKQIKDVLNGVLEKINS